MATDFACVYDVRVFQTMADAESTSCLCTSECATTHPRPKRAQISICRNSARKSLSVATYIGPFLQQVKPADNSQKLLSVLGLLCGGWGATMLMTIRLHHSVFHLKHSYGSLITAIAISIMLKDLSLSAFGLQRTEPKDVMGAWQARYPRQASESLAASAAPTSPSADPASFFG